MAAGVACWPCRKFRFSSRQCQQAQWKSRQGFANERHTSGGSYDPSWKIIWLNFVDDDIVDSVDVNVPMTLMSSSWTGVFGTRESVPGVASARGQHRARQKAKKKAWSYQLPWQRAHPHFRSFEMTWRPQFKIESNLKFNLLIKTTPATFYIEVWNRGPSSHKISVVMWQSIIPKWGHVNDMDCIMMWFSKPQHGWHWRGMAPPSVSADREQHHHWQHCTSE